MSGPKLIPVDRKRCQAEKPNGPFRMGGPEFTRCSNKPAIIATEKRGRRGAMSMCGDCFAVFTKQVGIAGVTVKEIGR